MVFFVALANINVMTDDEDVGILAEALHLVLNRLMDSVQIV